MRTWMAVACAVLATGCQVAEAPVATGNNVCDDARLAPLAPELEETSGVAASRSQAGVFWTHNDSGGEAVVFALDSAGHTLARVRLREAANRDWEDIAMGPCEPGGEDCLWVAEIGDNAERHPHVAVYRIPEPTLEDTVVDATIFRFSYPDGPRDAEALFVTDAGIHVVNKGRSSAIQLYRVPPPYEPDATVSANLVQRLAPPPTSVSAQVTAAGSDGDGRVVTRTYAGLRFYEVDGDTLRPVGRTADIVAPEQLQGEGADFADGLRLVLTGEAQGGRPATVAVVTCDPDRPPPDTTP